MDMLVPFQLLYADGIERLAAESLLERQKWVSNDFFYRCFIVCLINLFSDWMHIGRLLADP